jgi:hypothetical protein
LGPAGRAGGSSPATIGGADAIVEGTVQYAGNRVRVTAQLIQVSTEMHLWADAYERGVSEILDLQRALATDIARRINGFVKPLDRVPMVNPEAYGLYLKGRYVFYEYTSLGWQQAIDHFNKAIETDPSFALAYSGLADADIVAGAYGSIPTEEALTRGKAAAAQGAGARRCAGERALRARDRAHLVRLGLGRRGGRVSSRARAQSQRRDGPKLARRLPVAAPPARRGDC